MPESDPTRPSAGPFAGVRFCPILAVNAAWICQLTCYRKMEDWIRVGLSSGTAETDHPHVLGAYEFRYHEALFLNPQSDSKGRIRNDTMYRLTPSKNFSVD